MKPPVALRRLAYRVGYRVLCVGWRLRSPVKLGVKCLLVCEGRVLLVRHTYGDRVWDLPGGSLKRGEPPIAAARREMHEELGIEGARWTPLGVVQGVDHNRQDTIHCFTAELAGPQLELDPGELADGRWFERTQIPAQVGRYVEPILARAATLVSSAPRPTALRPD